MMRAMRMLYSWLMLRLVMASHNIGGGQGRNLTDEAPAGNCECVPYYLCHDGIINTNGDMIIDARGPTISHATRTSVDQVTSEETKECPSYIDVWCCKKPAQILPVEPTPAASLSPLANTTCGQRNPQGLGVTVKGGDDGTALFGEFPWMVGILKLTNSSTGEQLSVYQCGGSLIHPRVVLTAAQCVVGKPLDELKIRAGEWDTQTRNELFGHQDRLVQKVIVHEGFQAGPLFNDIALIILHDPVTIAENVDTVCLPPQGEIFDQRRCFASGWGKNVFGKEGRYQAILKKIELTVMPQPHCQNTLRNTTRLQRHFDLHESFICAGGEPNKDTCKGDGGSPLVCPMANDPLHYQQAGIVSWGIKCGENNVPGVYVNVAQFRNWIDAKLIANNV